MRKTAAALLLVAATTLSAQTTTPEHGVFVEDIDKNADACTNFFDYANGAWRAANPIPPSMQRWSRRWSAGEKNKEQLRTLLDDVSKRSDWPKGTIDQQISDFYGSCMDEKQINALGTKPIEPLINEIKAIKTPAALQQTIAHLHQLQMSPLFVVNSSSDNHRPGQVIARVSAAGLGLPDRDYYFKPEKRFAEAREKYLVHAAKMFELAGYAPTAARGASQKIFAMEKRL